MPGTVPAKSSLERVRETLSALGVVTEIREFDVSTRTSADAAAAVGCTLGQIAKSLVFRARPSDRAVLVIASGANRVDETKVAEFLGEFVAKADAGFVRTATGFAIGGVAAVGLSDAVPIFIDRDLMQFGEIWSAAGQPNAVYPISPRELKRITGGLVIDLKA